MLVLSGRLTATPSSMRASTDGSTPWASGLEACHSTRGTDSRRATEVHPARARRRVARNTSDTLLLNGMFISWIIRHAALALPPRIRRGLDRISIWRLRASAPLPPAGPGLQARQDLLIPDQDRLLPHPRRP